MKENIEFNKENFELFKNLLKERKMEEIMEKIPMDEIVMYFGILIDQDNQEFKDKTLEKNKTN